MDTRPARHSARPAACATPTRRSWKAQTQAIAIVLLALAAAFGLSACGGTASKPATDSQPSATSSPATQSSSRGSDTTPTGSGYLKDDGDKDGDDGQPGSNDDPPFLDSYGPVASSRVKTEIASVIKPYYAAAAAGDGAKACPLLDASLIEGFSLSGGSEGCPAAVTRLFQAQHQRLSEEEVATMTVVQARVKGDLGLVVLGFKAMPMTQTLVKREGGKWKLDALFESNLT